MKMIDLRSDTVTRPTPGMLEAMMDAQVGDDVFGDDPTVNALEEKAASMFGKEAAVFCPSGTMTNQIAVRVHTRPGDEVICDYLSHVYHYEGGGLMANSGVSVRLIHGHQGRFRADDVISSINDPNDVHQPLSRLVVVENTCNKGGGSVWNLEEIRRIRRACQVHELKLHLDGARIFNALVETGETTEQYGELFDSVSICLSKGLGAPVGSLLIGDHGFILRARRMRKLFGGGMRQSGFLAAAGTYALDHHVDRLKEDHRRARKLADHLSGLPFVKEVFPVETNIVVVTLHDQIPSDLFIKRLEQKGILMIGFGHQKVRAVTHLDFDDEMLERVILALEDR
jgi:threonine aldolase